MVSPTKTLYSRFAKAGLFFLVIILPGVACNYPSTFSTSGNLSGETLRQTLSAQETAGENPLPDITQTPGPTGLPATEIPIPSYPPDVFEYTTRSGDTLQGLRARFNAPLEQYLVSQGLPVTGFLPIGVDLTISNQIDPGIDLTPENLLLPDGEAINSPTSVDFNVQRYVEDAGGFLRSYTENVDGITMSGADILQRVASESSVNPRLLLAFLEYRTDPARSGRGWVTGQPAPGSNLDIPLGFAVPGHYGLYQELVMAATHLNIGYYGWREGTNVELRYANGETAHIHPLVNPGTAGLQNLFAKLYAPGPWQEALYGQENFLIRYQQMFGSPWDRAASLGPLLPDGLAQPLLELPFAPGERWSLSGGPHPSWNTGSPRGALDFSPVTGEAVCAVSKAWARASAPGAIARAAYNVVALDLDGDGFEQTGWVLVYVHLSSSELIEEGMIVAQDAPLGHPSCERGQSTGKHVHIARKYNGEWLPADSPLPFILSGWRAQAGTRNYEGSLVKGDEIVSANPSGSSSSVFSR